MQRTFKITLATSVLGLSSAVQVAEEMTPSEWCLLQQSEYIFAYKEECKIIRAEEYEACE